MGSRTDAPRPRVLVVHFSYDGQTAKIARRIVETLRECGLEATLADGASGKADREIDRHDAVVVGAAVRIGRHHPKAEALVRGHLPRLSRHAGAFFSVSLTAAGNEKQRYDADRLVRQFLARTGWRPHHTATFAGALCYREYNFLLRLVMRFIASKAGGDTDTSRDYVYTDWAAVDAFARAFAREAAMPGVPNR